MTPGQVGGTSVLLAAAAAAWEAEALDLLARSPATVLAKRCMDLTDLLASAATGVASAAVVSALLPGLDADGVAGVRRAGLTVVVVAEPGELVDGDVERLRRIGVDHVLTTTELSGLTDTLARAAPSTGPAPGQGSAASQDPPDVATGASTSGTVGPGRVLVVWGPTGAPGRTTVAVGLGAELAAAGQEVLLLDADAYGASVAQHLGILDESSGLLAAVRAANTGALDGDRLAALARQAAPSLRVLTGLPRPDRWAEVRTVAFEDLLEVAVAQAAYVVVDVGFSLESEPADPFGSSAPQRNQMTLTALEHADEVVVVGAADPVGLARLARGLIELRDVAPRVRPRVVVNRTRATLGWSDREIHAMVEGFAAPVGMHFLPEDRPAADRALMAGRSLAESGESPLRSAVGDLARAVRGEPVHASSRRGLRRRRAGTAR
jgi:Mrp family chromosome partitioning ATPase